MCYEYFDVKQPKTVKVKKEAVKLRRPVKTGRIIEAVIPTPAEFPTL